MLPEAKEKGERKGESGGGEGDKKLESNSLGALVSGGRSRKMRNAIF